MTEPHDDRRLADLISDAVSDVEPANRLDAIRARTRNGKVTSMSSRRPWLYAASGAVATAAVITAIAAASGNLPLLSADDEPAPAGDPSPAVTEEPRPSEAPSQPADEETDAPPASPQTVAVYFVGDTPAGPRLYREFQRDESGADPLAYAVEAAIAGDAIDPDYGTLWPDGVSVASAGGGANGIVVNLTGVPTGLPGAMTEREAALALQQVVYSAQAALQSRAGVDIRIDGQPAAQLLGQPTSEPLTNAPALETLSLVSLSTPSEGQTFSGDSLAVDGVANSPEANVLVQLERVGGGVVAEEPITAAGWMGNKLFPFSGSIDIADLSAGDYVLTASTDDPSGGTEGFGAFTDTRQITIE
jgi:hypothetical protein